MGASQSTYRPIGISISNILDVCNENNWRNDIDKTEAIGTKNWFLTTTPSASNFVVPHIGFHNITIAEYLEITKDFKNVDGLELVVDFWDEYQWYEYLFDLCDFTTNKFALIALHDFYNEHTEQVVETNEYTFFDCYITKHIVEFL